MDTKDRILSAALALFNDKGLNTISSKTISEDLSMSYGNLCYHFPKKEDIIMRLHQNLLDELDEHFQRVQDDIFEFDFMMSSIKHMMELTLKYRFLFLSSNELHLKYPSIKQKSIERARVYQSVLFKISKFLMANGYMRNVTDDKQVKMFIHGLLIVFNAWIADALYFHNKAEDEQKLLYYLQLLFSLLRPALTTKGTEAFHAVYNKMMIQD
ncbi:TetR/AcrR family transcriptional regulator [Lacinutrix neustonica]|uniref:TetR/AcrR family transcriptional regulator n=1 Tax=Lacinutrix neustonica TaxID=2980107 RepID=A0A9E8MVU6_9FLAO|nr:TetR/AcrR family transcriptional regulator [Lacinutrix neustonica]WAC02518.1 TetR/AcrR family transcriptional regulator [Lacinutrix neustonica]